MAGWCSTSNGEASFWALTHDTTWSKSECLHAMVVCEGLVKTLSRFEAALKAYRAERTSGSIILCWCLLHF